jgi:8-amino-7-oxononanoate synthase
MAHPPQTGSALSAFGWLSERAAEREAAGLRRRLQPREPGEAPLDLASNDYLGLARHPEVVAGACAAASAWGAGSTGSRLVTGSTTLHTQLEAALAEFSGWPAGLVFSSGYLANLATITALTGPGSLIVSDAGNHASIIDACRLSRARVVVTPHRDPAAVESALASRTEPRAIVISDAVFSVDGELAPLVDLHAIARRHGAGLVIDDAHGLGVIGAEGRGAVHAAGLAGEPDVAVTVTLSKSLGAQGGALLAAGELVEHVIDAGRAFIFDTGLSPAAAGAALAALVVLAASPELPAAVRSRARDLATVATEVIDLPVTSPDAAVVSVLVGAPAAAVAATAACLDTGVRVGCFRPPSVPDGISRLRLTARADLSGEDISTARTALAAAAVAARRSGAEQAVASSQVSAFR